MTSCRGFTFIEILIALVIASIGTVTVGYFAAGVSRMHNETAALTSAIQWADQTMQLVSLYQSIHSPDITRCINQAARDNLKITIKTHQPDMFQDELTEVKIQVTGPDLSIPVQLTHIMVLGDVSE